MKTAIDPRNGDEGDATKSSIISPVLKAALEYLDRGWRPIPIIPRGKRPLVPWEEYQRRTPTRDEVREWFTQ